MGGVVASYPLLSLAPTQVEVEVELRLRLSWAVTTIIASFTHLMHRLITALQEMQNMKKLSSLSI